MYKIIKIIILSIIAIALTGIMIILIKDKDFNYINILSYKSELILEKEYKEDIKDFDISSDLSNVTIRKTESDVISIKVYGNKRDEVTTDIKDNTLYIKNDNSTNICLFFCIMNSKIEIMVPKEEYDNLKIKLVSGDIELGDIKFNNINASSKSGDIKLDEATKVDINLVSGNINFKEIDNGTIYTTSGNITGTTVNEINAKTISGDIRISNVNKACQITATSGNINISNLNILNKSTLKTISGNVTVNKSKDIYIEASTISGNINIENNNRFSQIELKVSTTSGNINIFK